MNYYNFIVGLEGNKISVAKLQSTDGTAEGTELLDANGLSTHPSVKYFISKEGIELDPPSNKTPFSYLYNFTGTDGCSSVQDTFIAANYNLTFLPDNIKSLYEPQVTSNKIEFITPTNSTVTLTDRPGRFIDYNNPDRGSVGEDYDFDVVNVPSDEYCWFNEECSFVKNTKIIDLSCEKFNFSIKLIKKSSGRCDYFPRKIGEDCIPVDIFALNLYSVGQLKLKNTKLNNCDTCDGRKNYDLSEVVDIEFKSNSQNSVEGDIKFSGKALPDSPSSIAIPGTTPGLGISLLESALVTTAGYVTPGLNVANGAKDVAGVAGAVAGETSELGKAVKTVANVATNPVGAVISFAFDLFSSEEVAQTFKDLLKNVSDGINKLISDCKKQYGKDKDSCTSCIDTKFREDLNNKNSPMRKNINKIITASKIQPCC